MLKKGKKSSGISTGGAGERWGGERGGLCLGKTIQAVVWGMHWAGSDSGGSRHWRERPVQAVAGPEPGSGWSLERRGQRRMLEQGLWRGGKESFTRSEGLETAPVTAIGKRTFAPGRLRPPPQLTGPCSVISGDAPQGPAPLHLPFQPLYPLQGPSCL